MPRRNFERGTDIAPLGSGHLLPGRGSGIPGGGVVVFFSAERGGVVIFWDTLETILHRNFKNFLWGSTPRPPPLCITINIMSSWYPPLLLKGWEDNDPIIYKQVEGGGGTATFPALYMGGCIFFFGKLGSKIPNPPPGNK